MKLISFCHHSADSAGDLVYHPSLGWGQLTKPLTLNNVVSKLVPQRNGIFKNVFNNAHSSKT